MSIGQIDNLLMKKLQQYPYTGEGNSLANENAGSSALKIMTNNIWTLPVPAKATDINYTQITDDLSFNEAKNSTNNSS